MSTDDKRLIEDYLPIQDISAEASREKSVRKGHISSLHLWWARRPLVACRAAVYGSLVPLRRFRPANGPDGKRDSLTRANAAKFLKALCTYPGSATAISEAEKHILEAHAERLSEELGRPISTGEIISERVSRPKVLDMFAGGGAIPLEAQRLGCDTYALDLNPVAHIIELCTLVYPEKYLRPDPSARGIKGDGSWAGLIDEIRHWANYILKGLRIEIGDLYPLVRDPNLKGKTRSSNIQMWPTEGIPDTPPGTLMPVAYLWTRTITCRNPSCRRIVPLVKQTWLCKKEKRFVAMKVTASKQTGCVNFEVVEATSPKNLGFDPEIGSSGGNATCLFCGTVADSDYVKAEGRAGRMGTQLMAVACTRSGEQGKVYLSAASVPHEAIDDAAIEQRIRNLCSRTGLTVPSEPIEARMTGGICLPYGLTDFGKLFTPRQKLTLLTLVALVRESAKEIESKYDAERAKAVVTYLAVMVDRIADFNSSLCVFNYTGGRGVKNTFARQALPMVWDFAETNPFNPDAASWISATEDVPAALKDTDMTSRTHVVRGSATELPWADHSMDAVITDPPYYDNIDYAKISDFFYVWLKRSIGDLYPDHFATATTPKKNEAVADPVRHDGSKAKARIAYERMMATAFREAHRVLKPNGQLSVVYAHKTTLGWATLVESLRQAGFTVTEAWPIDTEKPGRVQSQDTAALASSITLACRKRAADATTGSYEDEVKPELEEIVRERVMSLWDLGISGADLVISCVGAGLRPFTRYSKVEYANGEQVPAERFLTEVETAVLEAVLARLSREVGGRYGFAGLDPSTRFYILWRYTYKIAELDAGEAIIFANGTHVELDGMHGLSYGARPLIQKNKSKYYLRDYSERGADARLGIPSDDGQAAPIIDCLHRLLWLMERHPSGISEFIRESRCNFEQVRLVAQALSGPALKGGELGEVATGGELSTLTKLMANWRSVVEQRDEAPLFHNVRQV